MEFSGSAKLNSREIFQPAIFFRGPAFSGGRKACQNLIAENLTEFQISMRKFCFFHRFPCDPVPSVKLHSREITFIWASAKLNSRENQFPRKLVPLKQKACMPHFIKCLGHVQKNPSCLIRSITIKGAIYFMRNGKQL